ncbi:MAG: 2-phospho-L-lactate transferase [Ardenticatenaceae bacterium]|nr:2-phospho-L-lactate transferase [Ardenticatenaceae bacterium]
MLKVVVLCGGVGGSKFVEGLSHLLLDDQLTIIGNTGDDFVHLGLRICPDLDTVMYRLADEVNREQGWGRRDETWHVLDEIKAIQGPSWFQLGDRDLAIHMLRSHWLQEGVSLTEVTARLCERLGVTGRLLPMSDRLVPTTIKTAAETLGFQEWFVGRRWQPAVEEVLLPVGEKTTSEVILALETADLILIAPSNPYVSVEPILNINPIRTLIQKKRSQTIAISPLVGDTAVKGPIAKLMTERGVSVNAQTIVDYYQPLIAGFVQDERDQNPVVSPGVALLITDTLMKTVEDEVRLVEKVLNFGSKIV